MRNAPYFAFKAPAPVSQNKRNFCRIQNFKMINCISHLFVFECKQSQMGHITFVLCAYDVCWGYLDSPGVVTPLLTKRVPALRKIFPKYGKLCQSAICWNRRDWHMRASASPIICARFRSRSKTPSSELDALRSQIERRERLRSSTLKISTACGLPYMFHRHSALVAKQRRLNKTNEGRAKKL